MFACDAEVQSAVLEWRGHLLKDQKFSVKRGNGHFNDLQKFLDFYAGHLGFGMRLEDMTYVSVSDFLCFYYGKKHEGVTERSIIRMVNATRKFLQFLEETQSQLFKVHDGKILGFEADVQFVMDKAQTDNAYSQVRVSEMFKTGIGVPKDMTKSLRWLMKAGDNDNQDAQFEVGEILYKGEGVPRDEVEAAQWFAAAGVQRHRRAAEYLGVTYRAGFGVPKNKELSERWYSQSELEEK